MAKKAASGKAAKKTAPGKGAKKTARDQPAQSATLTAALKENTAALNAHALALSAHAAAMTPHAIALTPANAVGACTIVFRDDRPDYCQNGMTNRQCQELAAEKGGVARPVVAGQKCLG
jgi:hypothetical protein